MTAAEAASYLCDQLPADHGSPGRGFSSADCLGGQLDRTCIRVGAGGGELMGLWSVSEVYRDLRRDPSPLIAAGAELEVVRADLLAELIPVLLDVRDPRRPRRALAPTTWLRPRRRYRSEQLLALLSQVAAHLRDARIRNWRWWQRYRVRHWTVNGGRWRASARLVRISGSMFDTATLGETPHSD